MRIGILNLFSIVFFLFHLQSQATRTFFTDQIMAEFNSQTKEIRFRPITSGCVRMGSKKIFAGWNTITVPEAGIEIDQKVWLWKDFITEAEKQAKIISEWSEKTNFSNAAYHMKLQANDKEKIFVLLGALQREGQNRVFYNLWDSFMPIFKHRKTASMLLLKRANFYTSDLGSILQAMEKFGFDDSDILEIITIVENRYPKVDFSSKLVLYNALILEPSRVEFIKTLKKIKSVDIEKLGDIYSDEHRLAAITHFIAKAHITSEIAVRLIHKFMQQEFKMDAIKLLSEKLAPISKEHYAQIFSSLSASNKNKAEKLVPHPIVSPAEGPRDEGIKRQSDISSPGVKPRKKVLRDGVVDDMRPWTI